MNTNSHRLLFKLAWKSYKLTFRRSTPSPYRFHNFSHVPVNQVSAHIQRIDAVEKELKALAESAAGKDDISRVRTEMKKLYDGLHLGKEALITAEANSNGACACV
jgi:hypothetical protein